jgi:hypothetical protein
METRNPRPDRLWQLPPLILHPFSESNGPDRLVDSSRANLMLQGLLPSAEAKIEDLERRLLDGRYCEIRMLYYVGKDVLRWVEQCLEISERDEALHTLGLSDHSFLSLLIKDTPFAVREKLRSWGVSDYQAIFTRAAALNTIFAEVPEKQQLSTEFIRNYYRYADQVFACSRSAKDFPELAPENFRFDLYASGEYSRILERSWEPI